MADEERAEPSAVCCANELKYRRRRRFSVHAVLPHPAAGSRQQRHARMPSLSSTALAACSLGLSFSLPALCVLLAPVRAYPGSGRIREAVRHEGEDVRRGSEGVPQGVQAPRRGTYHICAVLHVKNKNVWTGRSPAAARAIFPGEVLGSKRLSAACAVK